MKLILLLLLYHHHDNNILIIPVKSKPNRGCFRFFVAAGQSGCSLHVQKVSCEGKKRKKIKKKNKEKEEGVWNHTGTSKQTGVEFQQCGKQQPLDWRGWVGTGGSGAGPPPLPYTHTRLTGGRRVAGHQRRKRGWNQQHKQTQPAPAPSQSRGTGILDKLADVCWQEFRGFAAELLASAAAAPPPLLRCLLKASPNTR